MSVFTILSNHTQTGVIDLVVPTYSPTTLSVGFTGLALCSYTECCGLGGWVGLLGGIAPADLVCVTTVWIFGLLEKQKFDLQFSDGNFSGFGNYSCGKSF